MSVSPSGPQVIIRFYKSGFVKDEKYNVFAITLCGYIGNYVIITNTKKP